MNSDKRVQSGNEGKELFPGKTENLSSIGIEEGGSQDMNAKLKPEGNGHRENRDIGTDKAPADPDAAPRRAVNDPAATGGGHSGG